MKILLTGGLGFIGVNFISSLMKKKHIELLNIDKISYASMPEGLRNLKNNKNYYFTKVDLNDYKKLKKIIFKFKPDKVIHLAAESHVDNSINGPGVFIHSNILGTYNLLEISREYIQSKSVKNFRFLHVSTDEVYGSLNLKQNLFDENSRYDPSSPYSASKASSDLLVKAWYKTYNLPILITHCTNNFGPWQFPEKLIPLVIYKCVTRQKIPIYGKGDNIRDWIFVLDHVNALEKVLRNGKIGNTYDISTKNELTNLQIVNYICDFFNKKNNKKFDYKKLIIFVKDRKGHDFRYAINNNKIVKNLDFKYKKNFKNKLNKTIKWYLKNYAWLIKKIK